MAADHSNVPGTSRAIETNNLRIYTWRALRHRRREHVGGMGRCRAPWRPSQSHALGHHGNPVRSRWRGPAAVSAEEGVCHRPPRGVGCGGDYAWRWGTDGLGILPWLAFCTGATRVIPVYGPPTPQCRDPGRARAWRSLHGYQVDRACLIPSGLPRLLLGAGPTDR